MEKLTDIFLEKTPKSPQVDFNLLSGELILFGKSIPEDAAKIYQPLVEWTNKYIQSPKTVTNFRLNLEYFNTASMIWISKIIKILCKIDKPDYVLLIHLYFDKDDFDQMETDDLRDFVESLISNVPDIKVNVGIKAYSVVENGMIDTESLIFMESKQALNDLQEK